MGPTLIRHIDVLLVIQNRLSVSALGSHFLSTVMASGAGHLRKFLIKTYGDVTAIAYSNRGTIVLDMYSSCEITVMPYPIC